MMTKLKLNVYRAEDEFITMQRLQWRREEEENKKERKKVIMMMALVVMMMITRMRRVKQILQNAEKLLSLSVRLRLRRRWRR